MRVINVFRVTMKCCIISLMALLGFTSCMDVEDEFGVVMQLEPIEQTEVTPVNGSYYSSSYEMRVYLKEMAGLLLEEVGYVIEVDKTVKKVAVAHSRDELHNLTFTLDSLKYNKKYTIYSYLLARQNGGSGRSFEFHSDKHEVFKQDSYPFLKIKSFQAHLEGDSIVAELSFNDIDFQHNSSRMVRHGFELATDPEFKTNPRHIRDSDIGTANHRDGECVKEARAVFKNLCADRTYYCRAYIFTKDSVNKDYPSSYPPSMASGRLAYTDAISCHTPSRHDADCAVDLGLSVLWSSHDYGSTDGMTLGEKSSYKVGIDDLFAYDSPDGQNWGKREEGWYADRILVYSDVDPIRWMWGNGWRLPTPDEMKELMEKCQWEEVPIEESIYMHIYRITGPNGNFIYLYPDEYWLHVNGVSSGQRYPIVYTWVHRIGYMVEFYHCAYLRGVREKF